MIDYKKGVVIYSVDPNTPFFQIYRGPGMPAIDLSLPIEYRFIEPCATEPFLERSDWQPVDMALTEDDILVFTGRDVMKLNPQTRRIAPVEVKIQSIQLRYNLRST